MIIADTIPPIAPPDTPPLLFESAAVDGIADGELLPEAVEGVDVTINGGTTGVGVGDVIAEEEIALETAEDGLGAADEDGLAEVGLADAFVVVAFFVVASLDSVGLLVNLMSSSVTAAF